MMKIIKSPIKRPILQLLSAQLLRMQKHTYKNGLTIDYHLTGLEFDQIYVYDNSNDFQLRRWFNSTRQHPEYQHVEVNHYPGGKTQQDAYYKCVNKYGKNGPRHDYIALIDYDEFIVLQQSRHASIHDLLEEYLHPYGGALAINWLYMGSANRTVYSPIPVTKRFQYSDGGPHGIVKTIVKSSDFVDVHNPHTVELRQNSSIYEPSSPGTLAVSSPSGASNHNKPGEIALVHHYRFMSDKEFLLRQGWRNSIDGVNRGCDEESSRKINMTGKAKHLHPRTGTVFNDKAWKFLVKKVPKYSIYDFNDYKDFF